jgi:hypothetical protein
MGGCSSGAPPATVAPCLIGRWSELGETIVASDHGAPVFLKGRGRVLDFSADGYETVDDNGATPLTGRRGGKPYRDRQRGTIRYRVSTHDGTLTFSDDDFSHFHESVTPGGVPVTATPTDSPPVRYTCGADDQAQTGNAGTVALFKRITAG